MFLLAVRRGKIVATSLVMAITEGREPLAKLRLNIAKLRQLLGVITVARVIYWIPKVENYIYWDEWESFAPGLWLKWYFQKLDRKIFSPVCCCGKNSLSINKSPKLDYSRFNKSPPLHKREKELGYLLMFDWKPWNSFFCASPRQQIMIKCLKIRKVSIRRFVIIWGWCCKQYWDWIPGNY